MWRKKARRKIQPQSEYTSLNTVIIDEKKILQNFSFLQSLQPNQTIIPVLKSNAYGHGIKEICMILSSLDRTQCPLIAVDSFPEYQIVRDTSNKDILIMGEQLPTNYKLYQHQRSHLAIGSLTGLSYLAQNNISAQIHLFLNTGMNREGLQEEEIKEAISIIQGSSCTLTGIMSHLANADCLDDTFNQEQEQSYEKMYQTILSLLSNKEKRQLRYTHIGNSAGIAKIQQPTYSARRTGIALYGYNPLQKEDASYKTFSGLQPALSIKSVITAVQQLKKGDGVNYGLQRKASKKSYVASFGFG